MARKRKVVKSVWDTGIRVNPETGETAPEGYMWARSANPHGNHGAWFLERIGAMYTASPASETYWCS